MASSDATNGAVVSGIRLQTPDVNRQLAFYSDVLGLSRVANTPGGDIALGAPNSTEPMVILHENRAAGRPGKPVPGLFHFAILLPSRKDLGLALLHLSRIGWPLQGASDHLVSEALYLTDPDGNGIEIYRDRPSGEWLRQNGEVTMTLKPLDIGQVTADARDSGEAWSGMPDETRIGHIHLQVSDIKRSAEFYKQHAGLDITNRSLPGAVFLSTTGYHHHLGLNSWRTAGARRPDGDLTGLLDWRIAQPEGKTSPETIMEDPDGIKVILKNSTAQ